MIAERRVQRAGAFKFDIDAGLIQQGQPGGPGHDHIYGGRGNDTIYARDDTRDVVDCGPGHDTAYVDPHDVVRNCEKVKRSRDRRD